MPNTFGLQRALERLETNGFQEQVEAFIEQRPLATEVEGDRFEEADAARHEDAAPDPRPHSLAIPAPHQAAAPPRRRRAASDAWIPASLIDAHGHQTGGTFTIPQGVIVISPPIGFNVMDDFALAFGEASLAAVRICSAANGSVDVAMLRRRIGDWITHNGLIRHMRTRRHAARTVPVEPAQVRDCVLGPRARMPDYDLADSNRRQDSFRSFVTLVDDIAGSSRGTTLLEGMPRSLSAVATHRGRHGGGVVAMFACTSRNPSQPELDLAPAHRGRYHSW